MLRLAGEIPPRAGESARVRDDAASLSLMEEAAQESFTTGGTEGHRGCVDCGGVFFVGRGLV